VFEGWGNVGKRGHKSEAKNESLASDTVSTCSGSSAPPKGRSTTLTCRQTSAPVASRKRRPK
jgi:hypothetical protein